MSRTPRGQRWSGSGVPMDATVDGAPIGQRAAGVKYTDILRYGNRGQRRWALRKLRRGAQ